MMTIWIINEYAGSPEHGMSYRHYYLAKEWVSLGCKVVIISATYSHFLTNLPPSSRLFNFENINGIEYVWVKVQNYGSSHDKRRVLKWFEFVAKLFFLQTNKLPRPDLVLCSPTAPFVVFSSRYLANKFKAKMVFEVRDIWPLTLVEIGGYSSGHPFIRLMAMAERFGIKKSDMLVSNLSHYNKHLRQLGYRKASYYIPNGVVIPEDKGIELPQIDVAIPQNRFIIGYTGTLGHANALEWLIEAMRFIPEDLPITAVLIGQGKNSEFLKKQAENMNNVVFIPAVAKEKIPQLLKKFDLCYIGWRRVNLYEFGVSPNKIFDYMLSGKPILHSISIEEDIVTTAKCGIRVPAEDPRAIADAILTLYRMTPSERSQLGKNGLEYVVQNHDYRKLSKQYLDLMNALVGKNTD